MFYCETCRQENNWTKGIRGVPTSLGRCEMCEKKDVCYDVPSHALDWGVEPRPKNCKIEKCKRSAIKGRKLCEYHAFPAEREKSNRRAAIEATRKKKAKAKGSD